MAIPIQRLEEILQVVEDSVRKQLTLSEGPHPLRQWETGIDPISRTYLS